jgi:hypothetical protein
MLPVCNTEVSKFHRSMQMLRTHKLSLIPREGFCIKLKIPSVPRTCISGTSSTTRPRKASLISDLFRLYKMQLISFFAVFAATCSAAGSAKIQYYYDGGCSNVSYPALTPGSRLWIILTIWCWKQYAVEFNVDAFKCMYVSFGLSCLCSISVRAKKAALL